MLKNLQLEQFKSIETYEIMIYDRECTHEKNLEKVILFILSDSEAKNGGFLDLSGSKETRECKAI